MEGIGISQHDQTVKTKSEDKDYYEDRERNPDNLYSDEHDYSVFSPLKSSYMTLSETYDRYSRDRSTTDSKLKSNVKKYDKPVFRLDSFKEEPSYELYSEREKLKTEKSFKKSVSDSDRKPDIRYMPSSDNQSVYRYSVGKYPGFETGRTDLGRTVVNSDKQFNSASLHEKQSIIRREKEPQTFDGKSIDWQDYLVHFEQVSEWKEWNDLEKAKQNVMSLRGPAQKILSTLSKQDLGNYNKIRDSLSSRFNPKERQAAYSCEIESRRQNKDETVSEYGQALRRLGYLAFPNEKQDSEMLEKVLINKFIRGLNSLDLQKHVQFQRARTLDTAISYAIEYEAFINPQNHMRKPVNESENIYPVQAIKDNRKGNSSSHTESVTLDQVARLIDEKLSQFCKTNEQNSIRNFQNMPPRYNNRGRGRFFRNQVSMANRVCYKCNETGHIQYYCPLNKQGKN